MKTNECTHVIFYQTLPHPSIDVSFTSLQSVSCPFRVPLGKVSYMSPFMICNKYYRFEVAFDVGENCTMAMFGVGVGGRG